MALKLKANNGNLDLNTDIGRLIKGDDGGYYIPAVDEAGNLSWEATEEYMPAIEGSNIKGPQGEPGKDGLDGKNGLDGKDGYTPVKGVDYFDGKDGAAGKDGIDGKDGEPGKDGADGKPFTYEDFTPEQLEALRGPEGKQGIQGPAGEPGKDGVSGKDGVDGKDGIDGEPGVYVGTEEPTDDSVIWINPEGGANNSLATTEYVDNAIANALAGIANAEDGAY
jgi:hypothetical protein